MNISQHINEWSKKILKEAIEDGYDPSKDEFRQSDELKGMDDYEAEQEYKKWMKDRENIMNELAPKSTNEGCCDEKEESSDAESVLEDGEGGDKKPEAPTEDPDTEKKEKKITDGDDQEQIDEGIWDNIKDTVKKAFGDFGNFLKDKWNDAKSGLQDAVNSPFAQKSVKMFSNAITGAGDDIDTKNTTLKVNFDGKDYDVQIATVTTINDGKYIMLCYDVNKPEANKKATLMDIGAGLKENGVKKMTVDIRGIVTFPSLKVAKESMSSVDESSNFTDQSSFRPITNVTMKDGFILFEVDKSRDEKNDEQNDKDIFK